MNLLLIAIGGILVNNFVMSRFLGICPFLGVSDSVEKANGMGAAVTFVIVLASFITWLVYHYFLMPLQIEYMRTLAFILVIAVLVQSVEMFLMKMMPSLYRALGVYLPLITTNCAVLGVAILNIDSGYTLMESIVGGLGAALGFWLAIVLFAAIRERLELSDAPKWLQGFPLALFTAGLMSLAFQGFAGLI